MKLWVGLGNPGPKYAGNRHNIGFMALDRIAADHGFSPWKRAFQGLACDGRLGSDRVLLLKPETFMNLSGQSVGEAMRFHKLTPADVMVFHDELDLAPGKLRLKQGGGHAGHNGLRSIHAHIGEDYGRVRLGIGHPGHKDAVSAYVLHDFAKADQDWLDDLLRGISDGAPALAAGDGPRFLNAVAARTAPARNSGSGAPGGVQGGAEPPPPPPRFRRESGPRGAGHPDRLAEARGPLPVSAVCDSFRQQAEACAALGSPLTARLCRLCADRLDGGAVAVRVLGWPGNPDGKADALALRLMGGLHALVLTGADAALAAAYAAAADLSDDHLWAVLAQALETHAAYLLRWLDSPPQTNEVRRSAPLIAAGHWLAARFGLPLVLSELGASAGLNLMWDRWRLEAAGAALGPADAPVVLRPDWRGAVPVACAPQVIARAGVDLSPVHPVQDRLRLLSYIWADQPDRLDRTRAALDVAAADPPAVAQGDAVDWLDRRLSRQHSGALHLVFHTVAWQYFPADAQVRGAALLAAAGARATADAPLARLAMEADSTGLPGAALTLDLWPEGRRIALGRVDFHGRWVDWQAPAA